MNTKPSAFDSRALYGINRREFLALGALGAVSLLFAPIYSPTDLVQGISIAAYHDATGAEHQKQFDAADGLFKKGYRNISLSVYRDAVQLLYTAVWLKGGANKAWRGFHGLSSAQYQQFFNTWQPKGYRPVIVTATGGGTVGTNQTNSAIFAGVFEKDATPFLAKHDINSTSTRSVH